ncbi:hypothetical protein R69927_01743 [Paraburkholderia domus]|jgi:hypothetical protein|uniref:Uncharacterized protein n=1 Tax=Paraburkholderia domus TaxID=2793075 RepID=A0A9N8QXD7_9BURK|nr:hypothetical protein [Paraburkholderia domus]MBK5048821.1 hypothetical protein [Burkholderia sp. R-70006]MBK5061468.1 hypothetical protein [Burkholderia sp. R-70199]MBK5086510.1 hypothetical protein [Burkholderia sp. R-69927]MBK5120210.1 hypothetical protein [Burkholderia sp. R-69980]MBK5165652.1 hypothetical protein [Burkholderia sp. R-70211]MCI0146963.1 hypothetical protein [Paraburkholderia sediminicola]
MLRRVVDRAKQIRRSEGFKHSVAMPRRISLHAKQRLNKGVFSIEIQENSGFFSVMQMVLFILMYCDEKCLTPCISARGGLYGDAEGKLDWFSACFESVHTAPGAALTHKVRTSTVRDLVQLGFRQRYEAKLQLDSASELFFAYYRPATHIYEEVESICRKLGLGTSTLGAHFRGTDKALEAVPVSWRSFCQQVESTLADNPHLTRIFISSDEQAFIDFFIAWPFSKPVKVAPAKLLACGSTPVHFSGYPGLEIGHEALVSSLLLANCGFLVKTPSYLSAWSKIFNPSLPVRLVSPPRPDAFWFPDSQLWLEQAAHDKAA